MHLDDLFADIKISILEANTKDTHSGQQNRLPTFTIGNTTGFSLVLFLGTKLLGVVHTDYFLAVLYRTIQHIYHLNNSQHIISSKLVQESYIDR